MAVKTGCLEDVDRRLIACRDESVDQDLVNVCRRVTNELEKIVYLYQQISKSNEAWRDDVFHGVCPYDAEREREMKTRFEHWLTIDEYAQKCYALVCSQRYLPGMEMATEYQRCLADARETLKDWTTPRLSEDPVLREMTLNREQSRKIKTMLGSDW